MGLSHEFFMKEALHMAKRALELDEVPVGAVIVSSRGEILARAHNMPITLCDPTAHAEILCLREAAKVIKNYRLTDLTLYVTIEPCVMCVGAMIHARIKRLVFGAHDPKAGACKSLYSIPNDSRLNHQIEVISNVLQDECAALIQDFFKKKRVKTTRQLV